MKNTSPDTRTTKPGSKSFISEKKIITDMKNYKQIQKYHLKKLLNKYFINDITCNIIVYI